MQETQPHLPSRQRLRLAPRADSLAKRGDGVNDLSFSVASLAEERGKLESKGVELVKESQDGRSAFFDTRSEGNIMIRLDQR